MKWLPRPTPGLSDLARILDVSKTPAGKSWTMLSQKDHAALVILCFAER